MTRMSSVALAMYEFGPVIGRGAFGEVRVAINIHSGQEVAVKITDKSKFAGEEDRSQLLEEVRIHGRLCHRHVVRLHEFIETDFLAYIVLELVEGRELRDYLLARERLRETEAKRLFRQIIDGVEHCHSRRVVHRDIKLENILLDQACNVKLIDFGLAAELPPSGLLTRSCGSLEYAAPEIISPTCVEYRGPEVDVWSCGVVLFALLCRRLPFAEETVLELQQAILDGQYCLPEYLSDGASDLLTRMLHTDRLARISMPAVRLHSWFQGKRFVAADSCSQSTPVAALTSTMSSSAEEKLLTTSFVLRELGRTSSPNHETPGATAALLPSCRGPYRRSAKSAGLRFRAAMPDDLVENESVEPKQMRSEASSVAVPLQTPAFYAQCAHSGATPSTVADVASSVPFASLGLDSSLLDAAFVLRELGQPAVKKASRCCVDASGRVYSQRRCKLRLRAPTDDDELDVQASFPVPCSPPGSPASGSSLHALDSAPGSPVLGSQGMAMRDATDELQELQELPAALASPILGDPSLLGTAFVLRELGRPPKEKPGLSCMRPISARCSRVRRLSLRAGGG